MASPSRSPASASPPTTPTPGDNLASATVAISTSPTLATKLPPQAVAGSSSAQIIVVLPIQAVSSPVKAVFLFTFAVTSVSPRSGYKRSRNDERSSFVKWFCSGEKLLRTRLEIPPLCKLAVPPVQGVASGGHETNTATAMPSAASTVSTPRMEVSI